jgi:hypothetical protein
MTPKEPHPSSHEIRFEALAKRLISTPHKNLQESHPKEKSQQPKKRKAG